MDPEPPAPAARAFHVWLEDQTVVAAVWISTSGYYWCQSWDSPDLPATALEAAAEWGITPDSPPAHEFNATLDFLRSVIPLAVLGHRNDGLVSSDDVLANGPDELIRRLVCSGLDGPTALTTLT